MIEEPGLVVTVEGEYAEVQTQRRGACGGCSANGVCGTSLLERYLGRRSVHLRALNRAGAGVGDRVLVGVSEQGLVKAAVAGYLLPLLGLIAGALLGQSLGRWLGGVETDIPSLVGAAIGFALALRWLRRYSAGVEHDPRRRPVVLRRLPGESTRVPFPGT
jgi:sigma-E factor negative regulatory protein RseC